MNPSLLFDSTLIEPPSGTSVKLGFASQQNPVLVLDRSDPSAKMAHFYVLSIEASLFGDVALIREWGRIGTAGQQNLGLHDNKGSAMEALEVWLHRKQRRGCVAQSDQR